MGRTPGPRGEGLCPAGVGPADSLSVDRSMIRCVLASLGPVREHDAGDVQALEGGVHLGGEIEVAGGLVQQLNFSANQDLQIFGIHQRM